MQTNRKWNIDKNNGIKTDIEKKSVATRGILSSFSLSRVITQAF